MKRFFLISVLLISAFILSSAQPSTLLFDQTLRLDYVFTGNAAKADIALAGMSVTDNWYGRNVNMNAVPVKGNGQITMRDAQSGEVLYSNSFSTLFQEWQATPEAKIVTKAFQNTYLVPMPQRKAIVTLILSDMRFNQTCIFEHPIDPKDILISRRKPCSTPYSYIHKGDDPKKAIDIVILAEGYTASEIELFYKDAHATVDALMDHEPFKSNASRFNFLAVAPASKDSGVSIPREGKWLQTPVGSHFDTFYSERYLTTTNIFDIHDLLTGLPYEHLIILANTDTYGGGGIYNSYTLTTAHHKYFHPVVVHEFGHSFGALADEYAYAGEEDPYYFSDVEPWEQNITTKVDFASKWQDMMGMNPKAGAAAGDKTLGPVGLYEGAGYQAKGVWRPTDDCRMRTNVAPAFCPVCQRAIQRIIDFNTIQK